MVFCRFLCISVAAATLLGAGVSTPALASADLKPGQRSIVDGRVPEGAPQLKKPLYLRKPTAQDEKDAQKTQEPADATDAVPETSGAQAGDTVPEGQADRVDGSSETSSDESARTYTDAEIAAALKDADNGGGLFDEEEEKKMNDPKYIREREREFKAALTRLEEMKKASRSKRLEDEATPNKKLNN